MRGKVILSLLSRDGHGGNGGSHNVVVNTQGMISALSIQVREGRSVFVVLGVLW